MIWRGNKLEIYKEVAGRPLAATQMLWAHRRTLRYLAKYKKWKQLRNFIFVTYLIRGEDCGKGVLDPMWKFFPKATPFLWDLEMEVTTRCYLRCVMCEHTHWPDKSYLNQDLELQTFQRVIDSIPNLRWINLTGEGSAFLNPHFMHMVKYAKKKGLYVDFSHDFLDMEGRWSRQLIDWGVERIYLSMEGATKETYESIRIGSDFDRVVRNIQAFVEWKKAMKSPLPEICTRYSFMKQNVHEIPDFVDLMATFGDPKGLGDEPSINFVGLLEFPETRNMVCEVSPEIIKEAELRAKKHGFKIYWSHTTHKEELKPPLDYCVFWTEPYIMITGHVVPCCAVLMSNNRPTLERYSFGNIHYSTLKDIWDSPYYQEFRDRVVDPRSSVPAICLGCRTFNTSDRARKYGIWDTTRFN